MTLEQLIEAYRTDVDSPYHKLRICTRDHYSHLCKPLAAEFGAKQIADIRPRDVKHWNDQYLAAGKVAMGHSVIGMLRILAGFGSTILEDKDCEQLSGRLGNMRFKMCKPRTERLTAEQAILIRAEAHRAGLRSIALAQALQFECMFRQRDVLGQWEPESEPGESDTFDLDMKWHRGVRWDEIDENFILTHVTSKRQKEIIVDLKLADMVVQELTLWFGAMDRSRMPIIGPVIVSEASFLPWRAVEFRRNWRALADKCGIPRTVRNMDTRAGAISEATDAGADLEHVRHAATHSDIAMTSRYSRNSIEKIAGVMQLRVASRKS